MSRDETRRIRREKQHGADQLFGEADAPALAEGAHPQQRLLTNSPRPVGKADLAGLFRGAMQYW